MDENSTVDWSAFLHVFWYVIVFCYGAIVGSFLNVVIYRLPLQRSLTNPPSKCPNCNYALTFWDNIPILSFLFLRARCRLCRAPISWRYPMVELTCGCLWVALYHRIAESTGISWVDFVFHALFAAVLLALVFIDLDHFIAPDELNWTGLALGIGRDVVVLALAWTGGTWAWKELSAPYLYFGWLPKSIAGALVYGGALFFISWFGFAYYARREDESFGAALVRYFAYLRDDDETISTASQQGMAVVGPGDAPGDDSVDPDPDADVPRLAFSPAFLGLVCAALLIPVVGWFAPLVLLIPLLLFVGIARRSDESIAAVTQRFCRSNDLGLPGSASEEVEASQVEADEFAEEAETGEHGAMGFGDVKLALAIGAILGPAQALLSLLVATAIGAIVGISLAARHRRDNLRLSVPFVPFMAAGAIVCMLFGPAFVTWYMARINPEAAVQQPAAPFPPGSRRRLRPVSAPPKTQPDVRPQPR
jgi:leader peptidase (prepilin peptidase) / N-methyltransferase